MVATVGSISVDLSTNTAKFTQGFKSAATTVDQQSKRMSNAVGGFAKVSKSAGGIVQGFIGGIVAGGALAAIGSITGALGQARQALSDFEEIGNISRQVGLTTASFQALSFGALEADVSQEKLNTSLGIFAKNAGQAEQGAGAMYSGLKKLNPELLRAILSTEDQEERLRLVSDAMAGMTSATEKAALATAVFGRGGLEMVRVLEGGSAALDDMMRRADELGIIIPDDMIQRAAELDDQLEVLGKVTMVNLNQALVNMAPLLVAGAKGMASFAKNINTAAREVDKFLANPSLAAFQKMLKEGFGFDPSIIKDSPIDVFMKTLNPDKIAAANQELYNTQVRMAEIGNEIKATEAKLAEFLKHKDEPGGMFDVIESQQDLAALRAQLDDLDAHAKDIKVTLDTSQARAALLELNRIRADLAQQFRASENASMAALAAKGDGLPGVTRYGGDTGDIDADLKRERADEARWGVHKSLLQGQTSATTDVGDDVDEAADTISGTIDSSGHYITGRFDDAIRAQTSALSRSLGGAGGGGGGGTGGGGGDFSYSGNTLGAGGSSSWAGRQFTIGGGGGSYAEGGGGDPLIDGLYRLLGTGMLSDPAAIAEGGGTANINVVVKPVMEGQRLSPQSSAEIKQAAAAGANAALRQFHGR